MWNVCKLRLALVAQLSVLLFFVSGCSGFLNDVAINQATQNYSATISGLSLGAIPGGTASAPPLTISTATGDTSTLQARIVDSSGNALSSWATFASTNAVSGLTLNNYTRYKYEVRALFPTGLGSTPVASGYWIPQSDDCKETRITDSPYANSTAAPTGANLANAFQICTADQLQEIAGDTANYGKYFKLSASLNMSEISGSFVPIGTLAAPFYGTINGLTRSIHNLFINTPTSDYVGLIGYAAGGNVALLNLTLVNVNITGQSSVGSLIGQLNDLVNTANITDVSTSGTVTGSNFVGGLAGFIQAWVTNYCTRCSSSVTVLGSGTTVGGLTGQNAFFEYVDSSATGNVSGSNQVGGLLGASTNSRVLNSHATGTVISTTQNCGGIIGNAFGMHFYSSYATGDVTCSGVNAGGFVGTVTFASYFRDGNYSTGNVSGTDYVGGFSGNMSMSTGTIENIYATGNVTGDNRVGGLMGRLIYTGGAALSIDNSFSTGNVQGNNASNLVSLTVGQLTVATFNGVHYASNATCINTSGVCAAPGGTGHDLSITPNYFFLSTNAPLTSWNFATIWQTVVTNFPTLQ